MLADALGYVFFQRALVAGVLCGIICGVIGSFVLVKRMSSISGGLAHASFGGVGFGYLVGIDPMLGALGFAIGTGVGIAQAYRRWRENLELLISIVWATGMSLGIVFIAARPGYAPNLISYLFGGILFVPAHYLVLIAAAVVLIVAVVAMLFDDLRAVAFDEEFAELRGLPVGALITVLLVLVAISVVATIRVVGVVLAIALFTLPAATARRWTETLGAMMIVASAVAVGCVTLGLFASFWFSDSLGWNVPTGPLIVLLAAAVYVVSHVPRLGGRRARSA